MSDKHVTMQYITRVSKEDEQGGVFLDTVIFGHDGEKNFLRVVGKRDNGVCGLKAVEIYDSRTSPDKRGFNPEIAHESHQTALSAMGYAINVDLAALLVWEHHHLNKPKSALLGECTYLKRSVELYVSEEEKEYHIVQWEDNDWLKDDGIPSVYTSYRDLRLAREHFEVIASDMINNATYTDVSLYSQQYAQFE